MKILLQSKSIRWKRDIVLRAHSHQRGAGPPAGAGSVFRAGRLFTLARVRAQFHFAGAPFRGTGSLIYKYRPISAPYSCGSRRRIAPWAISAGARRGPAAEAERARGGVNSTTHWASSTGLTAVSKFKPRLPAQWAVGTRRNGPSRMEKATSRMNRVRTAFLSTTGRVTNFPRVLGIRRTFQTLVFRSTVFEMYKLRAAHGRARRFEFRPTIFCMLVN